MASAADAVRLTDQIEARLRGLGPELVPRVTRAGDEVSVVVVDRAVRLTSAIRVEAGDHSHLLHAHVVATIGRGPTANLEACVVGIAEHRPTAIDQAASAWVELVAPCILSIVHGRSVCGAERFDGDEGWAVPGQHGFVGPIAVRGGATDDEIARLAGAALFAGAADLARVGLVHLAKATVARGDGGKGLRRVVEVDGHGDTAVEAALDLGDEPSSLTSAVRFAVFYPPRV